MGNNRLKPRFHATSVAVVGNAHDFIELTVRLIFPEKTALLVDLLDALSPPSVDCHCISPLKPLSLAMPTHQTPTDNGRKIPRVTILERGSNERKLRAVRVILNHNLKDAAFSAWIGDPRHSKGIGDHLLSGCLSRDSELKIGTIGGVFGTENKYMLALGRKLTVTNRRSPQGGDQMSLNLAISMPVHPASARAA